MIPFSTIDKSWTLFLDRDGVINREIQGLYVTNVSEFFFYEGTLEALRICNNLFGKIVIVTNQKGVSKGLMTLDDLHNIHTEMMQAITQSGGRIDQIYFCTDMDDKSPNRKPQHGMALQAQADFPEIDFSKSIIAGNKLSDMQFGRNAGMATVFIASTNPETAYPHALIDDRYNSLLDLAKAFEQ
ncbi:D-glycero-alpha-D-manno-heptose-1,7-bisphosphate 7-phosphatase [Limnovirga soli]|uniref:D,D-heptose 1,7-bisphosphate phosphatase n=1 Tax=Limnovirga soli TaxID=2656915 RepID=A0A8J8FAX5_9BACT|nr:HAD-IIIA family hydrolase [Limnovirga soli]NNV54207.1 HAD-IIIA family hydrolase [Limnovirga soli]